MHVLITDDLFTNRIQIGIVLKSLGYTFDEAGNGDQAIEKLKEKDYDLILMDIEMPVRNGLETTQFIRKEMTGKKRDTLILAITAHEAEDYVAKFKDYGFNGVILKPFTREKLESWNK